MHLIPKLENHNSIKILHIDNHDIPRPSLKCGDSKQRQHGFWDVVIIKGAVRPLPFTDYGLVNFSSWVINVLSPKLITSSMILVHFTTKTFKNALDMIGNLNKDF
jgi:hypothetical protein